jgi:cytoskeletal protein CcmA (bactofilin family)
MFQKENKSNSSNNTSINLIGNGTSIIGDLNSNGDVRIDGILTGNINISGKLVIGATGKVEGNITCQNADISGEVKGTVTISELLSLKANAKLLGDIVTGKISIEPSAIFTGTCNMGDKQKTNSNATETKKSTAQLA